MLTQRKTYSRWRLAVTLWNDRRHFPYNRQNPYEIWDDQYFLINLQQYADEHCFSYIC